MSRKDVRALIIGAVALFLACFLGVITLATFALKLGDKAKSFDWDSAFGELTEEVSSLGD